MTAAALEINNLNKSYGGLRVTRNIQLSIAPGELHGIIGPNGAGKTTLLSQLFGEVMPDQGTVLLDGQDISRLPTHTRVRRGLRRSFQITTLVREFTVQQNVMLAIIARQGHAFHFRKAVAKDETILRGVESVLSDANLTARARELAGTLSHGEQRRLELALAVQGNPKVVLLDEPMAGLGHTESRELTKRLAEMKGQMAAILVEHDLDAVFELADRVSVLVRGEIVATGRPDEIRGNAMVREVYLGEDA